jgi:central glycolytic genes regulator
MKEVFTLLQAIIPEGMEDLKNRYLILENISYKQPIGRRALSSEINISERILRAETELMKKRGLIDSSTLGMKITNAGQDILDELFPSMQYLKGLSKLEEELKDKLGLKQVIVVEGDADEDECIKAQLGKAGALLLKSLLKSSSTIAITGGTTIAHMVKAMPSLHYEDIMVVPARGSVGGNVELQANTLAAELAKKLDASYSLLNLPDNLSQKTINSIKQEPQVQKMLQKVAKTDIIIFGIGSALKMAKRREVDAKVFNMLQEKQAVSEVFGYYFDAKGEVVHSSTTIGIDIDSSLGIKDRIAIAGGKSKAIAIFSAHKIIKDSHLIVDEAAARAILELEK